MVETLREVIAPLEARLQSAEQLLLRRGENIADIRVSVASIDTKLTGHEGIVKDFRDENRRQYDDLNNKLSGIVRQLDPLKEHRWRMSGGLTVLAAVVSGAISLAFKFWK